jgi:hypothetical protein
MAGPIYKLYMGTVTEAWYQLSEEGRKSLSAKLHEAREKAGGKIIVHCHSWWSSDRVRFFGVEEYPDIEAVQKHAELEEEIDLYRYLDRASVLGTKFGG